VLRGGGGETPTVDAVFLGSHVAVQLVLLLFDAALAPLLHGTVPLLLRQGGIRRGRKRTTHSFFLNYFGGAGHDQRRLMLLLL
jgi:hypothetical protein